MLPSILRFPLRDNPDFFAKVYRKRTRHVLAFIQDETAFDEMSSSDPSHPSLPTRFAVIVKKTHRTAVERVKFKRMIRSAVVALHKQRPQLFAAPRAFVLLPLGRVQSVDTYVAEIAQLLESTPVAADPAVPDHS